MNYQKIYDALIIRAKSRNIKGYFERHHVTPKCLGGDNSSTNIAKLTAREHFIAHRLLCKIYPTKGKLANALWRFVHGNDSQRRVSSKMYESIKIMCLDFWSKTSKEAMRNPIYKEKCTRNLHSTENRKKAIDTMMKTITTPEHKKLKSESCKKGWKDKRGLIPVLVFRSIRIRKPNNYVSAIWAKGEFVKEFPYAKMAALELGVTPTKICAVLKGRRPQANGFVFELKKQDLTP